MMLVNVTSVYGKTSIKLDNALPMEFTCNSAKPNMKQGKFTEGNLEILYKLSCGPNNAKVEKFGLEYCSKASNCLTSIMLSSKVKKKGDVLGQINDVIIKDFIKTSLDKDLAKFESYETLKTFAKQKYNVGNKKSCQKLNMNFNESQQRKECFKAMDQNFEANLKNCKVNMPGCSSTADDTKIEAKSYTDFKKTLGVRSLSSMVEYLNYRVEKQAAYDLKKDNERMKAAAELVGSKAFAGYSAAEKRKQFLKIVGDDPVIKHQLLTKDENDFNNFISSIYSGKFKGKSAFTKNFDKIRIARVNGAITRESGECSTTLNLEYICNEVRSFKENIAKSNSDKETLDKYHTANVVDEDVVNALIKGTSNLITKENVNLVLDAKRCITYGLNEDKPKFAKKYLDVHDETVDFAINNSSLSSNSSLDWLRDIKIQSSNDEDYNSESRSMGSIEEDSSLSPGNVQNAIATHAPENNNFNDYNPASNYIPSTMLPSSNESASDSGEQRIEEKSEAQESSTSTKVNDEKVNDLVKRLAAAEDKVEKMRISSEEAEEERTKQAKIAEEEKLIKELRDQISELKTQNTKKTAESTKAEENSRSKSRNEDSENDYDKGRNEISQKKVNVSDSFDSYIRDEADSESTGSSSKSRAPASTSVASAAPASANGSSDNSSSGSQGLILTMVDGMSAEKATETIYNRILELKGLPFLIEELGMVKEIVPMVKDGKVMLDEKGKPIYEKIVKGKVSDKKFAKAKANSRVPASITNSADLKLQEEIELKKKRDRYLEMKKMTEDALKKVK